MHLECSQYKCVERPDQPVFPDYLFLVAMVVFSFAQSKMKQKENHLQFCSQKNRIAIPNF